MLPFWIVSVVSAFGLVTVSNDAEYSDRPLKVMANGYVSIDQGEILDANILPNSSLTINGQLIHYDQGSFLVIGSPDLAGEWSVDGNHLLNNGHARFIVCPQHWYGIANAGVTIPVTCDDPVEVLLQLADSPSVSSSNDLGSGFAMVATSQNQTNSMTTATSLNPPTSSSSSFTIQTFSLTSASSSASASQPQSSNLAVQCGYDTFLAILGLL